MGTSRADLRRYPRARVAWRVIVEVPGSRPVMRETVDFSPYGAKIRLEERLPEGTSARLRFSTPDRQPLELYAIVRRSEDRKSTRLNSSHIQKSRMPSSA